MCVPHTVFSPVIATRQFTSFDNINYFLMSTFHMKSIEKKIKMHNIF